MLISTEEINEARIKMWVHASNMTDEEIEELLHQINKMVKLAIEIVERQLGEKNKLSV